MAETTDKQNAFDPILAIRYLEISKLIFPELYREFNKILADQKAVYWSLDDEGFIRALKYFSEKFSPYFKEYLAADPEAENNFDKAAPRVVVEGVFEQAKQYPGRLRDEQVKKIVDGYAARVRGEASLANKKALEEALTESLTKACEKATNAADLVEQTKLIIRQNPELSGVIVTPVLTEVIESRKDKIAWFARDEEVKSRIVEDSFTSPIEMRVAYTKIVTGLRAENPGVDEVSLNKNAEHLTLLAAGLLVDAHPEISGKFDELAKATLDTAGSKSSQLAVSAANAVLNREQALLFWDMATGKAFKEAFTNPQEIAKLDPKFVSSPTFARLQKIAVQMPTPGKITGFNAVKSLAATTIIGQTTGTTPDNLANDVMTLARLGVFNGDLNPVKKPSPPPAGLVQSAAAAARISAPTVASVGATFLVINTRQLFVSAVYAHFPQAFHLEFGNNFGWLLQLGSWNLSGKAVTAAGSQVGTRMAGTRIGMLLGNLIPIPGIGPLAGAALGWLGGNVLGKLVGGTIGKLTGLFRGGPGKKSIFDTDMPLAASIVVILVLATFIIPISFLPFNNVAEKVRDVAFVTSGEKPVGGGTQPNVDNKTYPGYPLPAASAIINCPVTGGKITQGPNQGNHVGSLANSYDIGVDDHTAVYPSHDGVIVEAYGDMPKGQHVAESRGNFIKIEGVDSHGNTYFTYYEHLFGLSSNIRPGTVVKTNTFLGYSDDTGNSTGPHLHYQCNGAICPTMMPAGCGGT